MDIRTEAVADPELEGMVNKILAKLDEMLPRWASALQGPRPSPDAHLGAAPDRDVLVCLGCGARLGPGERHRCPGPATRRGAGW